MVAQTNPRGSAAFFRFYRERLRFEKDDPYLSNFLQATWKNEIDPIFLSAPNTSRSRLRNAIENSRGFLYLVSLHGVTGVLDKLGPHVMEYVRNAKRIANGKLPVATGFGISSPAQVASLAKSGSDGAIGGSLLVKIVSSHLNAPREAAEFLRRAAGILKRATKAAH